VDDYVDDVHVLSKKLLLGSKRSELLEGVECGVWEGVA
jgi:hypothetical protein